MINHILADFCEHNLLIKKAQRLRRKNSRILFGYYYQYNLNVKYSYGFERGNAYWFNYGSGLGYKKGNGWCYRWNF